MKLFTTIFLLLSLNLFGQKKPVNKNENLGMGITPQTYKLEFPRFMIMSGLMFTTGVTNCFKDIIDHNPNIYLNRFPNANKNKIGEDAWKNKYKYGNPDNGPAFPGSTTILVPFTDAWHFTQMLSHIQVGTVIYLTAFTGDFRKIKFKHQLARMAFMSGCYYLGYNITDKFLFQH